MDKIPIYEGLTLDEFNSRKIKFRNLKQINEVIVHCSADDDPDITIEDINLWHKKKRWAGCGYHYFIDSKGLIFTGRILEMIGSHCRNYNRRSVGVCLNGDREFHEAQGKALVELLEYLREVRGLAFKVSPHNKYNISKTCPNFDVDVLLNEGVFKLTI